MTSHPSLKQTFLYPKLLKPLGASAIAGFDPVSLFPDGIPGYIAPKSQNFANSPFFFHNRSIAITASHSQSQVQFKKQTPDFSPTPSVTHQEVNDEDRKIDDLSQSDRTINLKSNIAPDSASNLSEIDLHNDHLTPAVDNPIINQETITFQSNNADVNSTATDNITPARENPVINRETIAPQLDTVSYIPSADKETITPLVENPIINQKPVTSESNNLSYVDLPKDKITPSIQLSSISQEIITPQSDNADVDSTNSDRITPAVDNSIINQETITLQSDNYSDITSADKETITPPIENPNINQKPVASESNNLSDVELPKDKITPSIQPSLVNPEIIAPQSDNDSDLLSPQSDRITSTRENPVINRETIKPQSDNISYVVSADKETITPPVENSIINQKPVASESNNLSDVELPDKDNITPNITPSIQPSLVNPETIAPQSDNADVDSPQSDRITSTRENPVINRETITPQSDNYSDITSADKETITPPVENPIINQKPLTSESNNLSNVDLPHTDKITPSIQPSLISQEVIAPQSDNVSDVNSAKPDNITAAIDKPIINRENITPKSDNITDISATNLESNNDSISTPEITPQSKKVKSFSLINILRKAIAFFSPSKKSVSEKEESINMRSPLASPELIYPKSQTSKNINDELTIPNRWSNIAELIARPSPANNTLNTKLDDESLSDEQINSENVSDVPQILNKNNKLTVPARWSSIAELINEPLATNERVNAKSNDEYIEDNQISSENISGVQQSLNNSESSISSILQKIPKNFPIQSSKSQVQNLDIYREDRVYKVQLSPENNTRSRYEYQSLNSKIALPEKTSFDQPYIQKNNNYTLSRTEEVGAEVKTETENNKTTENSETKATENENELLEVLAGEIYHLLQQRLEIEKERQGNYYR